MAYKELRKALLNKLSVTPQAIYQQANKIRELVPMTPKQALCIIAQRNSIPLDKYLDEEEIHKIRGLLQQVNPPSPVATKKIERKTRKQAPRQYIFRIGNQSTFTDPLLTRIKLSEANEMSNIFPYLYLLENSIRELIDRIMAAEYGMNWWDSQVPQELRKKVIIRMSADKRDSWHQRRGDRPIDYLDLNDLPRIMNRLAEVVVPDIIPSLEWFKQLVDEIYKSRCVVCHMNPLDRNNVNAVIVRFNHWQRQIDAKKDLILKLSSIKNI